MAVETITDQPQVTDKLSHDIVLLTTRLSMIGLGLWVLTPLSTIFQLYRGSQSFLCGWNQSTRRKPPTWAVFDLTPLVVIGTDWIGNFNSNYMYHIIDDRLMLNELCLSYRHEVIIKEMFYISIKLKPELARASMTTSDVNNQWRSNFQQQII